MSDYPGRLELLQAHLASLSDLAVAFSGGVDSSVLLHAAHAALGSRAAGVLGDSPSLPRRELAEADAFARAIGVRLVVLATDELSTPGYRANLGERCYFCRHTLFTAMESWARENGFTTLAYGEITDDRAEIRPGARAARELRVVTPLSDAGFSKADVRRYAKEHGLAVAEKPASACLSSRVPIGTPVTAERLQRIERAEESVRALHFRVLRVRDHGERARLELDPDELPRAQGLIGELRSLLLPLGFRELELAPYVRPSSSSAPARSS